MIINQYHTDEQIRQFAADELAARCNEVRVVTTGHLIREDGAVWVPCLYYMKAAQAPSIQCAACGAEITTPVVHRRHGYPVCSPACGAA